MEIGSQNVKERVLRKMGNDDKMRDGRCVMEKNGKEENGEKTRGR